MNIVVYGEGNSDSIVGSGDERQGAIKILTCRIFELAIGRRLAPHEVEGSRLPHFHQRGKGTALEKKLHLAITRDSYLKLDGIILIVDRDNPSYSSRLTGMEKVVDKNIGKRLGSKTVVAMAIEELEAWLLSDPVAQNNILGSAQEIGKPEELANPKEVLNPLISESNKSIAQAYDEIADQLDFELVAKKCPSFKDFVDKVKRSFSS